MRKKLIFPILLSLLGVVIFSSANRTYIYAEEIETPYGEVEGREISPHEEEPMEENLRIFF